MKFTKTLLTAFCLAVFGGAAANDFSIVNGIPASSTTYPWYVTVYSGQWQCGGALIQPNWVMTAAHCFDPGQAASTVSIVAGRQILNDKASGQQIAAKRVVAHAEYDQGSMDNDIALIELVSSANVQYLKLAPPAQALAPGMTTKAVGRGALAAPVDYFAEKYHLKADCNASLSSCVWEAEQKGIGATDIVTTLLLANGLGSPSLGIGYANLVSKLQQLGVAIGAAPTVAQIISGFASKGYTVLSIGNLIADAAFTDELREVDLPMVDNATCQNSLSAGISSNMICAGYKGTPKDTCQGDSGGPLVARNAQDSDWVEVGIVSWGYACATNYGVYTRVSNYLDWIGQHIPNLDAERVFMWGENVAASQVFRAAGIERSTDAYAPYWARLYPASGTALGVITGDQNLYWYDGGSIMSLGPLANWLSQAKAAGY